MTAKKATEKLFSLQQFGIKLGLENINQFLLKLDDPHHNYLSFHIAGSNGKGSTASFLCSLLMEEGYNTGLYTSPHFVKFNERIRINGKVIPDEFIIQFVEKEWEYIEKNKITFFEATTALAFYYFAKMNVDYAVIETGLGGRLDATNVLNPISSIITSICLEHTHILGNSISEIAFEKAGIIKEGGKVFVGLVENEALNVFKRIAIEKKAAFFSLNDFISFDGNKIIIDTGRLKVNNLIIPLRGKYQKINAALALVAFVQSTNIYKKEKIFKGISNVKENTQISGRYEILLNEPKIILDSAHNTEGIKNFLSEFQQEETLYSERNLLFAAMKDKSIVAMQQELSKHFDNIYFTQLDFERSATIEELLSIAESLKINAERVDNLDNFMNEFIKTNKNSCLVVTGSMYLVGKIKEMIETKHLTF